MTDETAVDVQLGLTLERVLRAVAWLMAGSSLAMLALTQLPAVDIGIPVAGQVAAAAALLGLSGWVLRTPLTDPATAERNRHRLEVFPWSIATMGIALQLVDPTHVFATLVLMAGALGATFMRRRRLTAMGAFIAAAQLAAAARAPQPDWLFAAGVVMTLTMMLWAVSAVAASLRAEVAAQLASRGRERAYAGQLGHVLEASHSLHTTDPRLVLETITAAAERLGWDRAGLYLDGDADELASRRGYPADSPVSPRAAGARRQAQERGETVVMQDYASHPDSDPTHHDLVSVVAAPILVHGEVKGALTVGRLDEAAQVQDVRLVELLATQAGYALGLAEQFRAQEAAMAAQRQLTELKEDFLATVSHELRTPLHVILGMAETLHQHWGLLDEVARRDLVDRMHRHADGLDGVITSLLDFSRLDAGRLELRREAVDVAAIALAVVARALDLGPDHDVRSTRPDGAVPTAFADAQLIERVIDNLVSNAVLHTPVGTRVTVMLAEVEDGVEVAVVDDGPGIDPDDAPYLTQRFYRGGEMLHRPVRGVGLGLPFCAEILVLHGAQLRLSETPGGGATFRFVLPRQPVASVIVDEQVAPGAAS